MVFKKINTDRPTCCNIGCDKLCHQSGSLAGGRKIYRPYCERCHHALSGKRTYAEGVTPIKKNYCENQDGRLGFTCYAGDTEMPSCMLDLDHKSGNHYDNNPDNLQTLCKCCHAYKSKMCGDTSNPKKYSE
jgi:hypothetical protein